MSASICFNHSKLLQFIALVRHPFSMEIFKNKLRLPNSNLLLLGLNMVLLNIPERRCLLIEKELGASEYVDVSADPGYKLLPSLNKCGFSNLNHRPKRVVGGKPSSQTEFPWMSQLVRIVK